MSARMILAGNLTEAVVTDSLPLERSMIIQFDTREEFREALKAAEIKDIRFFGDDEPSKDKV